MNDRFVRRVILKTTQSPGDVVMLTAAVREWKRALGAGGGDRRADAVPGAVGAQPASDAAGGWRGGTDRNLVPKVGLWTRQPQRGSCASRAGPESDETPQQRWE